jgi:pilus assembly protein CpaE
LTYRKDTHVLQSRKKKAMAHTTNILIVSDELRFREELESAFSLLDDVQPVFHYAADMRQAIEAARSRRPKLALIEMDGDVESLELFAKEAAFVSPETTVAAVFRPDSFSADVSESIVFIQAIRAGVKDFLRRPVSSSELSELLRRIEQSPRQQAGHLGKIVSFISNKGGVGKSTIAVNTACGLALEHPEQVLLVDASLQMGVCASLLNLTPAASLTDVVREKDRLDETLIRQLAAEHPCGLHLLAAPASAVEAADIDDEVMSRILTLARRTYEYVLVDTFPMVDPAIISVIDLSDRIYVVLENVVPTLLGAVKLVQLLRGLGVSASRQRIVLNRYTKLPGSVAPADAAARLGHDIDHVVPFDNRIVVAANTGDPYILHAGRFFGCGRHLRNIVADLDSMANVAVEIAKNPADQPAGQLVDPSESDVAAASSPEEDKAIDH